MSVGYRVIDGVVVLYSASFLSSIRTGIDPVLAIRCFVDIPSTRTNKCCRTLLSLRVRYPAGPLLGLPIRTSRTLLNTASLPKLFTLIDSRISPYSGELNLQTPEMGEYQEAQ